jgi:ABC-2 type transport system ATP-binding protein
MTAEGLAIEARGLVKRYNGDVLAVNGVDLAIPRHSIYALLGPNGAGKTTTISMLTTLIQPTGGSAQVCGLDVVRQARQVRSCIGVTFQETVLDDDLTGRQILDYHGRLYRQSKAERHARSAELLALVELEDAADRAVNTYSGGMKRRLELARGLMTRPAVLFLDEPTLGLDPQNRASIWDYIRNLNEQHGLTLLLTTHYLEEAEQMADCVGIIDHGQIVVEGAPQELISQFGSDTIRIVGEADYADLADRLRALPFVESVHTSGGIVQIGVDSGNRRLAEVVTVATQTGLAIEDISIAKPSLGDVFLKYTGRQLRDR